MEQSLFIQWVNKYFPGITVRVVETLNDTKNPLTYLHRRMLRKDFSVTGKWEALNSTFTMVAADVVAMDSSLPLKKRDAISKANGDIPKMGMELKLNERQLTDLDTLVATGASDSQILAKLFADTPKVIGGIWERNEAMFLEGLSTGVTLVTDDENVGTAVRLDFGYPTANKFGVTTVWSNTASKPLDDIKRVVDKAKLDGNNITRVMMDSTTFDYFAATTQVKERYAFTVGFVGSNIIVPDLQQVNRMLTSLHGFTIELVDRAVRTEKNGTQTAAKPWGVGMVVFLTSDNVGSLVWARLAEMNHPVPNVSYSTVDDFILVSKFRNNKPSLSEHTSSQARVVPVISNVDQIYQLDRATVQA
jgi:hypothetical protein